MSIDIVHKVYEFQRLQQLNHAARLCKLGAISVGLPPSCGTNYGKAFFVKIGGSLCLFAKWHCSEFGGRARYSQKPRYKNDTSTYFCHWSLHARIIISATLYYYRTLSHYIELSTRISWTVSHTKST